MITGFFFDVTEGRVVNASADSQKSMVIDDGVQIFDWTVLWKLSLITDALDLVSVDFFLDCFDDNILGLMRVLHLALWFTRGFDERMG